jgi:hypothetical protein
VSLVTGHVYSYRCKWITPPHRKIGIVVSVKLSWILWFNSDARFHGIGQMPVARGEHRACPKDCYLDLSAVQRIRLDEEKVAEDEGLISEALRKRLIAELKKPNRMLAPALRTTIINNLSR